jgi:hypothetical protein
VILNSCRTTKVRKGAQRFRLVIDYSATGINSSSQDRGRFIFHIITLLIPPNMESGADPKFHRVVLHEIAIEIAMVGTSFLWDAVVDVRTL